MSTVNGFNRSLIQDLNRDIFTPLSQVKQNERMYSKLSSDCSRVIFYPGTVDFMRDAVKKKISFNGYLKFINGAIHKSIQDIINQLKEKPSTQEDRAALAELNSTLKTAIEGMKTLYETYFNDKKDQTATLQECAKLTKYRETVEKLINRLNKMNLENASSELATESSDVSYPDIREELEEIRSEEATALFTEIEDKNYAEMSREEIEKFIKETVGVDFDNVRGSFYEICGKQQWEGDWVDAHFTDSEYIAKWKDAILAQFNS